MRMPSSKVLLTCAIFFIVATALEHEGKMTIDYQCPGRSCDCIWLKDTNDVFLECQFPYLMDDLNADYFSQIPSNQTAYMVLRCNRNYFARSRLWNYMFQHLKQLKMLRIENCNINELSQFAFDGLESLQEFTIEGASVETIHPRFLESSVDLRKLQIINSGVSYVPPLCSMSVLHSYNVSGNIFTSIGNTGVLCDDTTLHNLEVLDVRMNKIEVLPLMMGYSFPNLKRLTASDNFITKIESNALNSLPELLWLDLSNNSLSDMASDTLSNCSELMVLGLSWNPLTGVPSGMISRLTKLVQLSLDSLNVSDSIWDELDLLRSLEVLTLSSNKLTVVDQDIMASLSLLQHVNISHNKITKISRNAFRNQFQIFTLDISHNNLSFIPRQCFRSQFSCEILDLSHNNIQSVGKGAFSGLRNVKGFDLSYNMLTEFPRSVFSSMSSLVKLNLSQNTLERLPNFESLASLEFLYLDNNSLESLNKSSFAGLNKLRGIGLRSNRLNHLSANLFEDSPDLKIINLAGNRISNLTVYTFHGLSSLQYLNLDQNALTEVSTAFRSLTHLLFLHLSNNKLKEIYRGHFPDSLKYIDVSHNEIHYISPHTFKTMKRLQDVKLEFNKLRSLQKIAVEVSRYMKPEPKMYINSNPFKCDCNAGWLKDLNQGNRPTSGVSLPVFPDYKTLFCENIYDKEVRLMKFVPRSHFLCEYEEECQHSCPCCGFESCYCKYVCPKECMCVIGDEHLPIHRIHCENRNLMSVPANMPAGATEVVLTGNKISTLTRHVFLALSDVTTLYLNNSGIHVIENGSFVGLKSVTKLFLDSNFITVVFASTFKGLNGLKELHLENNLISFIEEGSLSNLRSLHFLSLKNNSLRNVELHDFNILVNHSRFMLGGNPWSCNQSFMCEFKNFLVLNSPAILDARNISCLYSVSQGDASVSKIPFLEYKDEDLCADNTTLFINTSYESVVNISNEKHLTVMVGVAVPAFLILVIIVVMIWKKEFLQVWCFSRFGWRVFTKEALDDDVNRQFDAFVCCSNKDEHFIVHELVPKLEEGERKYKLCLHFRDFPVGASIAETIVHSVENSKRTLIVLSDNFLDCEWCKFGFQTAHQQVLSEMKNRLIVIVMHEIDEKRLDPQLKLYMRTRTYLKYRDPWFWEKLCYAMPDVAPSKQGQPGENPCQKETTVQQCEIPAQTQNGRISIISENVVNDLYEVPVSPGIYQSLDSAANTNTDSSVYNEYHYSSSGHYEEVDPWPPSPRILPQAPPLPRPRNGAKALPPVPDEV